MPRTLPWLAKNAKDDFTPKKTITSVGRQAKATTTETAKSANATNDKPLDIDAIMADTYIDGSYGDDQWRMVEDELLFTAQEFTKSIHKAELERLQKQAKNRPKDTYRTLDSLLAAAPVVQKKRKVTRRRPTSLDIATDDEMSKDDDAFKMTKLGSLMTSPRRVSRNLAEITGVEPASKFVAGNTRDRKGRFLFKKVQSPQASMTVPTGDTTDDGGSEDDDLDAPTRRLSFPEYKPSTTRKPPLVDQDATTEDDDDDDLDTPAQKIRSSIAQTTTTAESLRTAPSSSKAAPHCNHKSTSFNPSSRTAQPSGSSTSKAPAPVGFIPDVFDAFYNDLLPSTLKRERP